MKIKNLLFQSLLCITITLSIQPVYELKSINNLRDIPDLEPLTPQDLIVFDIDKTILLQPSGIPVEPETIEFIRAMKDKGVTVIALTARDPRTADATIHQLLALGINFSAFYPQTSLKLIGLRLPAVYNSGIFFAGNNGKNSIMEIILNTISTKPERVLFFDDHLSNVIDVEEVIEQRDIPFFCFWYTFVHDHEKTRK